ncbi:MAG TPA: DUF4292 domain-containing protein [Polyangia bacterium]|jgi:hypothetical protein|nr:DUF4292 domain-containing protein [Polyangia bacterium]
MIVHSEHGLLGCTIAPTTSTTTTTTAWGYRGIAVLSLMFAACATAPAQRTYPVPTADELLAALHARQAAAHSLNLETRTTSWLGGERVRGTVQMLVERKGNLRFEAEVSLQGTVAVLAVNDGHFVFVDHQKKTFRQGLATPGDVASLIRIPLPAQAVTAILLGDVFLPEGSKALDVGWDRGADVLHLQTPDGAELWVSLHRPAPLVAAWDVVAVAGQSAFARARWRVSYQDLQRIDGQSFPKLIRFAEPGRDFDDGVEIKVRERIVNASFPADAFLLAPPPGYLPQKPGG